MRIPLTAFFLSLTLASFAQHDGDHPLATQPPLVNGTVTDAPLPASLVVQQARALATQQGKNVLILFHASWCGWCHKMQQAMEEPELKPLFEKSFVIRWLDVYEQPAKKALENPGAEDLLKQYKGADLGIPYFLVFDAKGNKLEDSQKAPGKNVGCPSEDDEVAYFVDVLKKTTKLTSNELQLIADRFKKNKG